MYKYNIKLIVIQALPGHFPGHFALPVARSANNWQIQYLN